MRRKSYMAISNLACFGFAVNRQEPAKHHAILALVLWAKLSLEVRIKLYISIMQLVL